MTKPPYKFALVVAGGILIHATLLSLIWFFLFVPIQRSYDTLLMAKTDLAVLETRSRLLKNLEEIVVSEQENFARIDGAFLKPDKVVEFIQTIETVASVSDVSIVFSTANVADGVNGIPSEVSFALEGAPARTMRAITLLEYMPFQATINSITLTGIETSTARSQISMSVLTAAR